jgi:hypothetical protein
VVAKNEGPDRVGSVKGSISAEQLTLYGPRTLNGATLSEGGSVEPGATAYLTLNCGRRDIFYVTSIRVWSDQEDDPDPSNNHWIFDRASNPLILISIYNKTLGGNGGVPFDDYHDIRAWGRIRQIVVRHGREVDSIGIAYANGCYANHGGRGGVEDKIDLEPDEFILKVEGRSGARLDQITFHSNKRVYGPYGGGGGSPFTVDFGGQALQYLFGRSGSRIDQIGFGYGDPPHGQR